MKTTDTSRNKHTDRIIFPVFDRANPSELKHEILCIFYHYAPLLQAKSLAYI